MPLGMVVGWLLTLPWFRLLTLRDYGLVTRKATNGFVLLIVKGIGGTRNLECLRDEPIIL